MQRKFNLTFSEPVLLNIYKHHADFLAYYIDQKSGSNDSYKNIVYDLKLIGQSTIDLYHGSLSPLEISNEIIDFLKTGESFNINEYKDFLAAGESDYRTVELSDNSKWILRLGIDDDRYVHIHPAKSSPHSERVKAHSLKSAILFIIYMNRDNEYMNDIGVLNYVRTEFLKLSPQKKFSLNSGVGKIISLLRTAY